MANLLAFVEMEPDDTCRCDDLYLAKSLCTRNSTLEGGAMKLLL